MSAQPPDQTPIEDKAQLVGFLAEGCKPRDAWRIGTEHEKFGFRLSDLRPLPYEGSHGIGAVLQALQKFGWQPILEGETVIGLRCDQQKITLEPGGQLELSGAPRENLHATCNEVQRHLHQVKMVGEQLGLGFIGVGFQPKWPRESIPVMPKGRYRIMSAYMPNRGQLGLDMMLRTCTAQVNLDFSSEADMVAKLRIGLALQPVAVALFANSPFSEGRPNGELSYRSTVWTDTDPDRCGILPYAFEQGMGFERYVDYALDVPMYFVRRDDRYIDASGQSFQDFLDGGLPALPGELPTLSDWEDHLTTLFPEVRLKRFLEMRGADGGPWKGLCALPALWVGLLYDQEAQNAAWELVKDWTADDHACLRANVPRTALNTRFRGRALRELALEVLGIAHAGLRRRAVKDSKGRDETHFLASLQAIAESGTTPAEHLLDAYAGPWQGNIDPLFDNYAY